MKCEKCRSYDDPASDAEACEVMIGSQRAIDVARLSPAVMEVIARSLEFRIGASATDENEDRSILLDQAETLLVLACAKAVGSAVCWHRDSIGVFPCCVDPLTDELLNILQASGMDVFECIRAIADKTRRDALIAQARKALAELEGL